MNERDEIPFRWDESFEEIHLTNLLEFLNLIFESGSTKFLFYDGEVKENDCPTIFIEYSVDSPHYFWWNIGNYYVGKKFDIEVGLNYWGNKASEGRINNSEICFNNISQKLKSIGKDTIRLWYPFLDTANIKPAKR